MDRAQLEDVIAWFAAQDTQDDDGLTAGVASDLRSDRFLGELLDLALEALEVRPVVRAARAFEESDQGAMEGCDLVAAVQALPAVLAPAEEQSSPPAGGHPGAPGPMTKKEKADWNDLFGVVIKWDTPEDGPEGAGA